MRKEIKEASKFAFLMSILPVLTKLCCSSFAVKLGYGCSFFFFFHFINNNTIMNNTIQYCLYCYIYLLPLFSLLLFHLTRTKNKISKIIRPHPHFTIFTNKHKSVNQPFNHPTNPPKLLYKIASSRCKFQSTAMPGTLPHKALGATQRHSMANSKAWPSQ